MSATTNVTPRKPRFGLGRLLATGLLALAAGAAFSVWAQGMPGGPGMGGHHMGGPGMGGPSVMMGDPARMGRRIDHLLDGLNATDAQRTQIKQIAQAAAADMKAQHEAGRTLREKGLQILAAPTIDAAAAEALRKQMLAQHDQASQRMLQAMLDIGKVLSPEQRAKLGERMKQRSERMQERMQRSHRPPEQKG